MQTLKNIYSECRQNQTMTVVGESALQCYRQAKLVLLARQLDLTVKFEQEQGFWLDYVGDVDSPKTWEKRFESGTHQVLYAYVEDESGSHLAGLGGIVVSCDHEGQDYLKAVELELLAEASQTLMKG